MFLGHRRRQYPDISSVVRCETVKSAFIFDRISCAHCLSYFSARKKNWRRSGRLRSRNRRPWYVWYAGNLHIERYEIDVLPEQVRVCDGGVYLVIPIAPLHWEVVQQYDCFCGSVLCV